MDDEDRKDFLKIISDHGFTEDDFEITETVTYPPPGAVGLLSGTRKLKHKESGTTKVYEIYGSPPTWFTEIEKDFAAGLYKKRK
jgi:hypothetical protein